MKMHLMLPDNSAMCGNKAKAFLRTSHLINVNCQKCLAAYNKQNNILLLQMVRQLVGALKPFRGMAVNDDLLSTLNTSDRAAIVDACKWAIVTLHDAEKIIATHAPILIDKSN